MLPNNPFWPKHAMVFKSSGGPSLGGVSLFPKSISSKGLWNSMLNPNAALAPTKNYIAGKGFVTDEKAKMNSDAADQAAAAAAIPTSSPTSASGADVLSAQMDLVQQEAMKKSIKKTIFAGDTGGFSPGSAASGKAGKSF